MLKDTKAVLELIDVSHTYKQGNQTLHILKDANLKIAPGEVVALVGPSGAGKSTLLHIAGLLMKPTKGQVKIAGLGTTKVKDKIKTDIRRNFVGFVYQYHHLLPDFTALENVFMPQVIGGTLDKAIIEKAAKLLSQLGLKHRMDHRPFELSGGEQQRTAIARALMNSPKLLLADEPTGNLDPETAQKVFMELLTLVRKTGLSALIATHNPELAARMDRQVTLAQGKLVTVPKSRNVKK